jgi:uracil-DNA glycosylase
MPKVQYTPLEMFHRHVEKWKDCVNCELHQCRTQTVFARGAVPCDVLFIGEAPGFNEDAYGQPFVGPAGQLLDKIIEDAFTRDGILAYSVAFGNLLCCIPRDESGAKVHEPEHDHVLACQERLAEFVNIMRPRLIVGVGKVAKEYLDQTYSDALQLPDVVQVIDITHPAAILRKNFANRDLMTQRLVIQLMNAVEDLAAAPQWDSADMASVGKKRSRTTPLWRTTEYSGLIPPEDDPIPF